MDLNILNTVGSAGYWVLTNPITSVLIYLFVGFVFYWSQYISDSHAADHFLMFLVLMFGWPVMLPLVLIVVFKDQIDNRHFAKKQTAQKQIANKNALREEFGSEFYLLEHEAAQEMVDERLKFLARQLKDAFDEQEVARRNDKRNTTLTVVDATTHVDRCKTYFWKAHALARENGFINKTRWSEYLQEKGVQVAAGTATN